MFEINVISCSVFYIIHFRIEPLEIGRIGTIYAGRPPQLHQNGVVHFLGKKTSKSRWQIVMLGVPIEYTQRYRSIILIATRVMPLCLAVFPLGCASYALTTTTTKNKVESRRQPGSTALKVASVGDALEGFYQSQPYLSAFITCSVKASAADFFSQKQQQKQAQGVETVAAAPHEEPKRHFNQHFSE